MKKWCLSCQQIHMHRLLHYDNNSHVSYNKSISNICKRMKPHSGQKRPHGKWWRTGFGHCVKSLPPMLKELKVWQHFWEWILLNALQKQRPGCLRESLLTFSCSPRKDIGKRANVRCPAGLGRNTTC